MSIPLRSALFGFLLASLSPLAAAQESGGGHHDGRHSEHPPGLPPAVVGFGFGIVTGGYQVISPPYQPTQPGFGYGGSGLPFGFNPGILPPGQEGPGGLMLPHLGAGPLPQRSSTAVRKTNPARAEELVEVGDRSFRGGNYRRAEERYLLALKANPVSPVPHVHLTQVSMVRSDYANAATHLRDAIAAGRGNGWLLEARDIQAMYGEPGDFSKQIAHLESYLQTHPQDRNAWFVLGAQRYFSGHARDATDALLRLTDRPLDEALTAFLDASTVANRNTSRTHASNR